MRCSESIGGGIRHRRRVEAKGVADRVPKGLDDPRRGWIGRLVGVELDPVLVVRRLEAGDVRLEAAEALLQEARRHSSRKHSRLRRGLTFCSWCPMVS